MLYDVTNLFDGVLNRIINNDMVPSISRGQAKNTGGRVEASSELARCHSTTLCQSFLPTSKVWRKYKECKGIALGPERVVSPFDITVGDRNCLLLISTLKFSHANTRHLLVMNNLSL